MKRKCFIGIIISLNLIILNVLSVFATSPTEITSAISAVIATLNAAEEGSARQQAVSEWIHKQSGALGFLFDLSSGSLPPATLKYLLPDPSQYENATDNEIVNDCRDLILNHQTVVNNEIVLDTTLNTCIKNFLDAYVDSNKYYTMYSLDLQYYSLPQSILDFVDENQDQGVFLSPRPNNGFTAVVTDNLLDDYGYVYQGVDTTNTYITKLYDYTTFNGYSRLDVGWNAAFPSGVTIKKYINSSGDFVTVTNRDGGFNMVFNSFILMKDKFSYRDTDYPLPNLVNTSNAILVSYGKQIEKIVYGNFNLFTSSERGTAPYYYNNEVWSNFVNNSSGDYTVTTSNVNTVTYGDTVSYINDYHDTNNNYPDNSTVNNWINTTNNNNTSGGSGGGSGGSGDDSGGSGIVSILTALGKAIADLITGIAAFLAEVVGGLVEAINGLLDTLTDLITNFTESIPNIFSPLLGWLFDGLPEEFTAIILLGLTACVIASIIKILRG